MAQYTPNYGLHQWEAGDSFLRTDFNEDHARIDAALGRTARSAEASAYNLYNLMLQNYYEGKYTGYKKALIFDGFADTAGVARAEPGAWVNTEEHRVEVVRAGAADITPEFKVAAGGTSSNGSDNHLCYWLGSNGYYTVDTGFTPSGFGRLTAVTLRMAWSTYNEQVQVSASVMDGDTVLAVSDTVSVSASTLDDYTLTFPGGVEVDAHHTYTLRLTNVNQVAYARVVRPKTGDEPVAAIYTFTPTDYSTGAVVSAPAELGSSASRALAWVRHSGGTAAVSLTAGDAVHPMTETGSAPTVDLEGKSCTERAFLLDLPAELAKGGAVRLELTAGGEDCFLYDYGVIFL